jgi:hypothetical protein
MMSEELNLDNLKKLMAHIDGDSACDHIRCMYALVSACPLLIAEVERLRSNNEVTDGTDYAHPSYWRGSDAAFAAMCEQLRKILDGEDDCSGKCQEPWDTLRRKVLALRQELATAKKIGAAEELERMAEPYIHEYLAGSQYLELANRPWECTQDLKNSINDCLKCELLNRAAELRAEGEA